MPDSPKVLDLHGLALMDAFYTTLDFIDAAAACTAS